MQGCRNRAQAEQKAGRGGYTLAGVTHFVAVVMMMAVTVRMSVRGFIVPMVVSMRMVTMRAVRGRIVPMVVFVSMRGLIVRMVGMIGVCRCMVRMVGMRHVCMLTAVLRAGITVWNEDHVEQQARNKGLQPDNSGLWQRSHQSGPRHETQHGGRYHPHRNATGCPQGATHRLCRHNDGKPNGQAMRDNCPSKQLTGTLRGQDGPVEQNVRRQCQSDKHQRTARPLLPAMKKHGHKGTRARDQQAIPTDFAKDVRQNHQQANARNHHQRKAIDKLPNGSRTFTPKATKGSDQKGK